MINTLKEYNRIFLIRLFLNDYKYNLSVFEDPDTKKIRYIAISYVDFFMVHDKINEGHTHFTTNRYDVEDDITIIHDSAINIKNIIYPLYLELADTFFKLDPNDCIDFKKIDEEKRGITLKALSNFLKELYPVNNKPNLRIFADSDDKCEVTGFKKFKERFDIYYFDTPIGNLFYVGNKNEDYIDIYSHDFVYDTSMGENIVESTGPYKIVISHKAELTNKDIKDFVNILTANYIFEPDLDRLYDVWVKNVR